MGLYMVDRASAPKTRVILLHNQLPLAARYSTTYTEKLIATAGYPQPVIISDRRRGWYEDEINSWLQNRPRRLHKKGQAAPGPQSARSAGPDANLGGNDN